MRPLRSAIGIVLLVAGVVWILQGSGLLKGSFMTGQSRWLSIGIACAVLGVVVLITARRSTPR